MCSTAVERLKPGFHLAPIILEVYTYTFNIKFDIVLYVCILTCVCTNIKAFNGNSAKRWGVDIRGGILTWGKTPVFLSRQHLTSVYLSLNDG